MIHYFEIDIQQEPYRLYINNILFVSAFGSRHYLMDVYIFLQTVLFTHQSFCSISAIRPSIWFEIAVYTSSSFKRPRFVLILHCS